MEKWIVGGYFVLLFGANFSKRRDEEGVSAYLLAGRRLTLFPFIATIVATAYGWVLGVGELYYEYGISAWLFLSLPYSFFGIFLALFLAERSNLQENITLSDLLFDNYGKTAGNLGTVLFLIVCSPAMYLLMAGKTIDFVWESGIVTGIVVATLFSTLYLFRGGFQALVKTDVLQFFLMYGGFGLLFFSLVNETGFQALSTLPAEHLQMRTNYSGWYILSWFMLATFTLIDPNNYQRIYAASSPKVARKGLLIAVIFWTLFDFFAATCGLFGLLHYPELAQKDTVYLLLGSEHLPPALSGLFFAGILSAIMSTADSFIFYSAITTAKDLLHRNGLLRSIPLVTLSKYLLILVSSAGGALAIFYAEDSVVQLFFDIYPVIVSVLLLPILSVYLPRIKMKGNWVLFQMVCAGGGALFYQLFQAQLTVHFPWLSEIGSIYPGMFIAICIQLIVNLLTSQNHD